MMHQAASRGDTRQLLHVVQRDPSLLEQPSPDGMTPLGQAVQSQQMVAVKRLVKMGANINAQDAIGRTCLSIAAYQGWLDGVVYLLRNGARQNISDKTGRLPIHAATYHTDPRTLVTLLQSSSSADINHQDHEQMTALHWAAFHRRPEHVRCLVARGASLLLQDMDGKLPLHWAAQNGCRETCRLLLHGSSLRESPGEGERQGEGGGDGVRERTVRAQDLSGKTALHFAAAAGHADVIEHLASYPSCDPDCPDPDDRTPLHWAAAMGHAQCVQTLLDLGVKVNVTDADGGTPLSYAQQSAHHDCVHLLEEALHLLAENTEKKAAQEDRGSKKGKTPLLFLKGLFQPHRKDSSPGSQFPASSPTSHHRPPPHHNSLPSLFHKFSLNTRPLKGTQSSKSEVDNERLSLPSIRNKPSSYRDSATPADVSGFTLSSLPSDNTRQPGSARGRIMEVKEACCVLYA